MEKFSKFKDPMTGINPFLNPKYKKITINIVLLAILKLPIYLLYLCGFPVLRFLISIKIKKKEAPKGIIFCNSVTRFDKDILKIGLGINSTDYLKSKTKIIFPEGTNSNNLAILKYEKSNPDWSIGLKYSNECIYMYGNKLKWLVGFLGNSNSVEVNILKECDISKAAGLPQVKLNKEDKERFLKLVNNHEN